MAPQVTDEMAEFSSVTKEEQSSYTTDVRSADLKATLNWGYDSRDICSPRNPQTGPGSKGYATITWAGVMNRGTIP